jgi:hypothetical protein
MICSVCYSMLRGHQGAQWRGTYDLHFDHHVDPVELQKSADMSCCICRSILCEIKRLEEEFEKATVKLQNDLEHTTSNREVTNQHMNEERVPGLFGQFIHNLLQIFGIGSSQQKTPKRQGTSGEENSSAENHITTGIRTSTVRKEWLVTAYLSGIEDSRLYQLDFKWGGNQNVGSFILERTSKL